MAGIGARSNDFRNEETEPVYLLTRRRSSFPPPPPASSRLVVAPVQESPRASSPRESSSQETLPRESSPRGTLGEFTRVPDLDNKWYGEAPDDDADDDFSDIRPVSRRLVRRRRAIRVLGALGILGALAGGGYVLEQPKVRHEALSFVTMGHPDAAVRAGRRIATFVEALRHH